MPELVTASPICLINRFDKILVAYCQLLCEKQRLCAPGQKFVKPNKTKAHASFKLLQTCSTWCLANQSRSRGKTQLWKWRLCHWVLSWCWLKLMAGVAGFLTDWSTRPSAVYTVHCIWSRILLIWALTLKRPNLNWLSKIFSVQLMDKLLLLQCLLDKGPEYILLKKAAN